MESYESVLLVKPEVFVFNIPPRATNRGYRAADWNLAEPSWTGRLRLVAKGNECSIKLEDKNSGELFAKCPIDTYPGVSIEAVSDSSRYFVLRIQDDNGRSAFVGIGFGDRSDSFDLNVALQDHFKWLKKEQQASEEESQPELDLRFKEGETIKINMKITKKDGSEVSSRPKPKQGGGLGLLPPPPGGNKLPAPPGSSPAGSPSHVAARPDSAAESWGDFTTAKSTAADWNLAEPSWTGRLRLVAKGNECSIKLEDKNSGELFAKCPIDTYPGVSIEAVSDSSRYFVLRIQDDNGRSAFVGIGFGDRSDSFDLNVALQDHFKWLKKEQQASEEESQPELDLRFKEGETIKINMKITKKDGSEVSSRPKPKQGGGLGLLPPPPGGNKLPAPPGSSPAGSPSHVAARPDSAAESWGDFTTAKSTPPASSPSNASANSNWVQF